MASSDVIGTGPLACVETGIWTPVPIPPPRRLNGYTLKLKEIDPAEHDRIKQTGVMSFHMVGCTGDFSQHEPQQSVARAMASQLHDPGRSGPLDGHATTASFFFHLGDVVYQDEDTADPERADQSEMYNTQFYTAYADYSRPIFAIAGNHDGKLAPQHRTSALNHFVLNFCAKNAGVSPDNSTDRRSAMTQPHVYWRLDTPLAYIVGLYTNIANGGMLDDPSRHSSTEQYRWLVDQLKHLKKKIASDESRRAVLLALHYPPYSGTTNFAKRGDPTLGPTNAHRVQPLGAELQRAFAKSGMRPDVVFSAHAHLYQRLTYRYHDGWEIPHLVAGSGGHAPVEDLWKECDGSMAPPHSLPFDAVHAAGLTLPAGDSVRVVAYDDRSFGFLRVTIAAGRQTGEQTRIACEFFTSYPGPLTLADSFTLDLDAHRVL